MSARTDQLFGLSCPGSSRCIAVGDFTPGSGVVATVAERRGGGKWSIQSTPIPSQEAERFCPAPTVADSVSPVASSDSQVSRGRINAPREHEAQRFAKLRPKSTALLERARASMPNGVQTSWMVTLYDHPAIVVESGNGGSITDVDGNRYREVLDAFLGELRA